MSKRHNNTPVRCIPLSIELKALAECEVCNMLCCDHIDIGASSFPSENATHKFRIGSVKSFDLELDGRKGASADRELKLRVFTILHDEISVNVDPDIRLFVNSPSDGGTRFAHIKAAILGFAGVIAHSLVLPFTTLYSTLPWLISAKWCDPIGSNKTTIVSNNLLRVNALIEPYWANQWVDNA